MASVTENYCGWDKVDEWLLNQVVKYVNHDEIGSLARDLRVEESVYSNIPRDKDKTFKVLEKWSKDLPRDYNVRDFVNEIKEWVEEGYVDSAVWKRFQKCVSAAVLPTFSKRSELRQRSRSSESLPSGLVLDDVEHQMEEPVQQENLPVDKDTKLSSENCNTLGSSGKEETSSIPEPLSSISQERQQPPSLTDEHVLELSKRFTNGEELYNLGVKVLHLKEYKIRTVLYDHSNSIQAATYKLLSTWLTAQKDRQQAYSNLLAQMRKYQMNELAGVLKRWVRDSYEIGNQNEMAADLQRRVKWSIERSWTKSLSNDWLQPEKAKTFSLMKFYTDLEWVETVEGPLRSEQRKSNMFKMFKVQGIGKKPINILVKAKPGMGKTSSMAYLAVGWATDVLKCKPIHSTFVL